MQKKTISQSQPERKNGHKLQSAAVPGRTKELSDFDELLGANESGSMGMQSHELTDGRLPTIRRQAVAFQIGHLQGNIQLQRIMRQLHKQTTTKGTSRGHQVVQRQLIVHGSPADFDSFRALVEPAIGLLLARNPGTNRVEAVGTLANPATSPAMLNILTTIMNNPAQDAELQIGTAQPGVAGGAFPQPSDLSAGRIQTIDIDDMEAIEAGAPGHGIAALAHEIQENYHAHSFPVAPGTDRFPASHEQGNLAQSAVAQDLIGPGGRVADRVLPGAAPNTIRAVMDFENYYLVLDFAIDPATRDARVTASQQVGRIPISTYTIDSFGVGSDTIPAAGAGNIASAAADLAGNRTSTARIEGFADATGNAARNLNLSRRRAEQARNSIRAAGAGVGQVAFHTVGLGADRFVAPNDTSANRARNRRVVIMIDRPDIP